MIEEKASTLREERRGRTERDCDVVKSFRKWQFWWWKGTTFHKHFMRKKSEKYRLWRNPSSWDILKQIQKFAGQIRVYSVFKYHFATNFLHGTVKLPGGNCTQWALKVRWSSGLHLFLAGQAHCICIQVLRSSPVIHLCGGLAHHELPYLALTEAKGKWLFPAFWIIVKQCY